jgi:hypothetical protein
LPAGSSARHWHKWEEEPWTFSSALARRDGDFPCPSHSQARSCLETAGYLANVGFILFCAIVTIVATALMPDYTNRDISEELV